MLVEDFKMIRYKITFLYLHEARIFSNELIDSWLIWHYHEDRRLVKIPPWYLKIIENRRNKQDFKENVFLSIL